MRTGGRDEKPAGNRTPTRGEGRAADSEGETTQTGSGQCCSRLARPGLEAVTSCTDPVACTQLRRACLPATFEATLNGVDIRASFHPAAGKGESVAIPLSPGRNVLVLSVQGQLPTRTATDTDRLVLLVQ